MVIERWTSAPNFRRLQGFPERLESLGRAIDPELGAVAQRIGLVSDTTFVDRLAMNAVTLEIVHRADAPINGNLVKIGAAES